MAKRKPNPPYVSPPFRWIAIDPGKRTGWALVDGQTIIAVGTCTVDELLRNHRDHRAPDAAVIEFPRVYSDQRHWKGDPQDIVKLAFECGIIAGWFGDYTLVEPSQWGGSAPKDVKWRRTQSLLFPHELSLTTGRLSEHARDALGIACWAMRRVQAIVT